MQVGSEWKGVLGDGSEDLGMIWTGWDGVNRGRYSHSHDSID